MRRTSISILSIILLALSIGLSGCEETRSGGHGATDLSRGEPSIVDSVLAIAVHEDRPDGITDVFSSGVNDQVFLWILWKNIEETHTVEVSWYAPGDDLDNPYRSDKRTITSTTGEKITWFYIDAPRVQSLNVGFEQGEWLVEIYLDGLFERSHLFFME